MTTPGVENASCEFNVDTLAQQADGFERDGLTAGVGTGNDQGIEIFSQGQVVGHSLGGVQKGVAGLVEADAPLDNARLTGPHSGFRGESCIRLFPCSGRRG